MNNSLIFSQKALLQILDTMYEKTLTKWISLFLCIYGACKAPEVLERYLQLQGMFTTIHFLAVGVAGRNKKQQYNDYSNLISIFTSSNIHTLKTKCRHVQE